MSLLRDIALTVLLFGAAVLLSPLFMQEVEAP